MVKGFGQRESGSVRQ